MLMMGLVLAQSLMVTSTMDILLYAKVSSSALFTNILTGWVIEPYWCTKYQTCTSYGFLKKGIQIEEQERQ